ncbi:MAG: cytochrome c oxidase accessory protein CcoG [Gammaproteobacteria bacterium]|nr:cytochrome c oxidase accessory protein CcoG [Gammaproteobacteria bacterium]
MSADTGIAAEVALYETRQKVYPREVDGRYTRLRRLAAFTLLTVFYGLPWLHWDGHQAVLFDLPARKFHVFSLTLWPQDFLWLCWLLIMAALTLFFVTAIAGRIWCGYACPQTVWTEAFLGIERLVEGKRPQRMKFDARAWTGEWVARKAAKQLLWILLAIFTGFSFVAYFTPARELAARLAALDLGGWESFWVLFYGFATYGNAGFLREQVCRYMCPYARFQSAMFDHDTLIVSYDQRRGEPRGAGRRGADRRAAGPGDCVDCTICVQACPTGIDIRQGLQYECIACAACVDACDAVMDKVGLPRGLIRYATENQLAGRRTHHLRPRVIAYGALLAALAAGFVTTLALRAPAAVDVIRDRNALWRTLPDGRIENVYSLRILNKDSSAHRWVVETEPRGAEVIAEPVVVPAGGVGIVPVRLRSAPPVFDFVVTASDAEGISARRESRFISPESVP